MLKKDKKEPVFSAGRETHIHFSLWGIWRNFYVRSIVFVVCMAILLALLTTLVLRIVTRHGQTYPVPELAGMSIADAQKLAKSKKMHVVINDSVYIAHKPGGMVIEQNPKSKVRVKKDRKLFVTINALSAKRVGVPDVAGLSLRQAKATLEMQGLEVGRLSFAPDIANNNVLRQQFRGAILKEGDKLVVGSRVDLVLGKSRASVRTAAPQLIGLSLPSARSGIIEASLNAGRIRYDESVKNMTDSLEAKVYLQYPVATEESTLEVGSLVDIFLTVNSARLGQ
ncbi:MAG: PASTA domain-containing protein [Prevotellaceae bacterium]|nr:PASTA domain-containing protein [Prevotellaceae bacterium]